MLKIFQILFIIGLGVVLSAQTDNKTNYIKEFSKARKYLKDKQAKKAEKILNDLINKEDIDKVGCAIKSEISNQLGVAYYLQKKHFDAFKEWNERTLPMRLNCNSVKPDRIAQTYYNIGYIYREFYDYTTAIKYIKTGLEILEKAGLIYKIDFINWYMNQYYFSFFIGDYNQAEGYAFKALSILDSLGLKRSHQSGEIYAKIGRNFIEKRQFDLAKQYLDISYRILYKSQFEYLAYLYRFYAILNLRMRKYKKSRDWSAKSLNFIKKHKLKDSFMIASVREAYGLAYSHDNKPEEALKHYFKTMHLRNRINIRNSSISLIYENIAGAYGRWGKLDSALYYIELSIDKAHSINKNIDLGKYAELRKNDFNKSDMIRKLQMKGKYLTRQYEKEKKIELLYQSEKAFSKADSLVHLLRREIQDRNSRIFLGENLDTIYKYAIYNAYLLWEETHTNKYKERAYYYCSENKAAVFSDTKEELNAVWEILDKNLRDKYLSISEKLKTNLYLKQYAILSNDTLAYKKLNEEYIILYNNKENLFKKIKVTNPQFYQYIYGRLKPVKILDLQGKLEANNAILEYYIDGRSLYIYSIAKNDFFIIKTDNKYNLDSLFDEFSKELSYFNNKESVREMSKEIYPTLFPKALNIFLDKNNITRLIVIRDKNMNKITFAPIMKGEDYKNDYLIYKYAFSYVFNNKYIWDKSFELPEKEYEFGGFATNYTKETLRDIAKDTIFWEGNYPPMFLPLKHSVAEVKTISKLMKSNIWVGQESTLENFKKNANKSNILHLSLHGMLVEGKEEQNALIFQKTPQNKEYILKSMDLIGLRLNNSLSVLSSCFSSGGDVASGEGMKSLARNFSLSGSPAIVASQWTAYEGQTMDLLIMFYKNLNKGQTKDIALQKAQIEYLHKVNDRFSSPANWANLVLIGDVKAIKTNYFSNYGTIGILLLIIIISAILLFYAIGKYKRYKYEKKLDQYIQAESKL